MPNNSQYNVDSLQDNLDYLNVTKGLIKNAIIEKGQEINSSDTFRSYAAKISNISGGSGNSGNVLYFSNMKELNRYNTINTNIGDVAFVYDKDNSFYNGIFTFDSGNDCKEYRLVTNLIINDNSTLTYTNTNEVVSGKTIKDVRVGLKGLDAASSYMFLPIEKISDNEYVVYRTHAWISASSIPEEYRGDLSGSYDFSESNLDLISDEFGNIKFLFDLSPAYERYPEAVQYIVDNNIQVCSVTKYYINTDTYESRYEVYNTQIYTGIDYYFYLDDIILTNKKLILNNLLLGEQEIFDSYEYYIRSYAKNYYNMLMTQYNFQNYDYIGAWGSAFTDFTAKDYEVANGWFYGVNGVEEGNMFNLVNYTFKTSNTIINRLNLYNNLQNLINASSVNNCSGYFRNNALLVVAPNFNTNLVTNMSSMFNNCPNLQQVPFYNTINVTSMFSMFCYYAMLGTSRIGCNIITVPNFNISNVTSLDSTFRHCLKLVTVPNFNTINVTTVANTFQNCKNLMLMPNWNLSNVTTMRAFLDDCPNLRSIPNFNTIKVNTMQLLCENCYNLVDVPQLRTGNVTNISQAFRKCNNLSNTSIHNIINMCLNSGITNSTLKNVNNQNQYSPLYQTIFDSTYYSNRLSALSSAGWSY